MSTVRRPPKVHGYAAGLGGRDLPLDLYGRLLAAVGKGDPEPFAIFDVDLDKLATEDR